MLSLRAGLLIGLYGLGAAAGPAAAARLRPLPPPAGAEPGVAGRAGRAYRLDLDDEAAPRAAADRGPPDAVVYVPAGFDPRPPVSVIVYLHGFYNCAENVLRDEDGPCERGGRPRRAHGLARQLEASGRNAILLSAETAFDRRSGSPGLLGEPGGLRRLLGEALRALRPRRASAAPRTPPLGRVVLFAHSAGYQAAAAALQKGGVPVSEVYLLDALYGNVDDFAAWLREDLRSLLGPRPRRRFASVAAPGGTGEQTEDLARDAARWLRQAGGSLAQSGLLFERSRAAHAEVPRRYFGWLLERSALPPRPRPRLMTRLPWPRSL